MSLRHPLYLNESLVRSLCDGLYDLQLKIREFVAAEPAHAWRPVRIDGKTAVYADLEAERDFREFLKREIGTALNVEVRVVGEESLPVDDAGARRPEVMCLIDAIDGTDLLQRGLGNWCSAVMVFDTERCEFLGVFVVLPDIGTYFQVNYSPGTYFQPAGIRTGKAPLPRVVNGPTKADVSFSQAAIAFYGQKIPNLLSVAGDRIARATGAWKTKTRIYNLAGTPFFTKLIDGHDSQKIHAIVELQGQMLHDALPGLILALKAGAAAISVDTREALTIEYLGTVLAEGADSSIRYVAASSQSLAEELIELFIGPDFPEALAGN